MRGFIIGLLLAGVVAVGQEKAIDKTVPAARIPVAVTSDEATQLNDAFNTYLLAGKEFENAVLRVKLRHSIPEDYQYNPSARNFVPPPTVTTTPPLPERKDVKP